MRRTAFVIGASRGIGRNIAQKLAENNYIVLACSRSLTDLNSLATEINSSSNVKCYVYQCDLRNHLEISNMISEILKKFSRIDCLVYNAGAIYWGAVSETNTRRFMLLQDVHIIFIIYEGKTAYAIGKVGMTVLMHGLAMDLKDSNPEIAVTALWPATAIKSAVTDVMNVREEFLRTPDIFSDAIISVFNAPCSSVTGLALIDEDWLRSYEGICDFSKYSVSKSIAEVRRMMPKNFPVLEVDEQEDTGLPMRSLSKL